MRTPLSVPLVLTLFSLSTSSLADWPQAAGLNHDWTVRTDRPVPLSWSAEEDRNIRWRMPLLEPDKAALLSGATGCFSQR